MADAAGPDAAAQGAGADASWWQAVTHDIARQEYAATPHAGGLQAPNRAQNLRTTFGAGGIDVVPRAGKDIEPEWRFSWQTSGVGRAGRMQTVPAVAPTSEGSRVSYRHEGWIEWYENTPQGLEQGFTLESRPSGNGELRIVGAYPPELTANLRDDGAVDFIDTHGVCVLRYGKLSVEDARGRVIAARIQIEESELALVIEDGDASYPLTVAPLLHLPTWTGDSNQAFSFYGASVMTAGDVNGDGYSDVIVGAHGFDNGETDEGRAFVYHGTPSGLSATANWTAECNQAGARFGASVATAGDVNGDGFDDVVVGAWAYDNGQTDEGRVFVYLGSAAGLNAAPAWSAESDQSSSGFGYRVAAAGDVNGDGYADVMVGAYRFDNGQTDEGRAFIYHGSASGVSANPNWTAESNQASSEYGCSVSTAGDVNGDGFSDVIVGAQFYNNGDIGEGRAYVYHGSPGGLSASPNWTAESNQFSATFGSTVGTAGDVNGDGYADVIVGAPFFDNGQSDEGRAFVYPGSVSGLGTTAAWTTEGEEANAQFASRAATAGDINGDGYSDVLVTNLFRGRAHVYEGSAQGLSATPASTVESDQGANSGFAVSLATAGDVNGDGFSDVIIGANLYDNGTSDEGAAFVYRGSPSGLAGVPGWTAYGDRASAALGCAVASAGDVNGDGYGDVVVGARYFDNGETLEGAAFVYHGSPSGLSQAPSWSSESNSAQAQFGASVGTAGDVNGDGYSDVIVGAPSYANAHWGEGAVFVYHGSSAGLAGSAAWKVEGGQGDAQFGCSVSTAGDVNGDGFSDLIVGASNYDNGGFYEGHAFVYHGGTAGLGHTPAWVAEGNQDVALFGTSVCTAGDVNGDGFSDVIVGAPRYDDTQAEQGKVFVYHGSALGLGASAAWTSLGTTSDSYFGSSVATAGDLNGDGFSDVIVGAPLFFDFGRAYVFYGSMDGLQSAGSAMDGDQPFGEFGHSVSGAGDVNGDGYSDVLVGARRYYNGTGEEGAAFFFRGHSSGLLLTPVWTVKGTQPGAHLGESVAGAGDVNGDGFSDVLIGAPYHNNGPIDAGQVSLYYGNHGDGLDRTPRQARTNDSAPIALLGTSDSQSGFLLKAKGRTAAGRGKVRIEYEVKPLGTPFNGSGIVAGTWANTGAPVAGNGSAVQVSKLVSGLSPGSLYHWRMRLRGDSPFFPSTPWLSQPENNRAEADLRTKAPSSGVDDMPASPEAQLFAPQARPNPFSRSTEIEYALPRSGPVRVTVHDANGRECAVLIDGTQSSGAHSVMWDGCRANGSRLPAGVYFARVAAAGRSVSRRLVLVP